MRRKAQSYLDYIALIAIIALSVIAMSGYIFNSIDARVGHIWTDLYHYWNGVR